jgi:hypothetical protein
MKKKNVGNGFNNDVNGLVKSQLIIKQIDKIEAWKGDAYQSGDDIELALEEIKRLIGYQNK